MSRPGPRLLVVVAFAFLAAAGSGAAPDRAAALVDGCLERFEAYGFSGALLVAREDEILLEAGYGLSDRAAGTPVTADTVFDIGSLSKQFTATAILALVQDGRLELHQPLRTLWPWLPADKSGITPHQLLTHTSGVDDLDSGDPLDRQAFVREWAALPVSSPPGESYAYSNAGYTLLAAIVEQVTDEPFEGFVRRRLFQPAGLRETAFVWETAWPWPPTRVAHGYGGLADSCGGENPLHQGNSFLLRGSGGVLSTVGDLHRWVRSLDRGAVLDPQIRDLLYRRHTVAEVDYLFYGYGWRIQQTSRGTRLVWHSGLEGAFSSVLRRYTDEGLTVVFLSNQSVDGVPSRDLLLRPAREGLVGKLLFGGAVTVPPPLPRKVALAQSLAGDWRGPGESRWTFSFHGGIPRLRAMDQRAADTLFPPDAAARTLHAAAGSRARAYAEAIARGDAERLATLAPILDPLAYSGRGIEQIVGDWQRAASTLGPFREVQEVATTWTRRGPPQRTVTHLRIVFEQGALDEKFLVWGDDEVYLIPCAPDGFELRLSALGTDRFVTFDMVSGRSWEVHLSTADRRLEIVELDPD